MANHVERRLDSVDWTYCGRCGGLYACHGSYVMHECDWVMRRPDTDQWFESLYFAGNPVEPVVYDDEMEFAAAVRTLQGQGDLIGDLVREMSPWTPSTWRGLGVGDVVMMGADGSIHPAVPDDTPIGVVVASAPHDRTVGVMRFGGMQPRRMGRP